jgi:hypothetical protein
LLEQTPISPLPQPVHAAAPGQIKAPPDSNQQGITGSLPSVHLQPKLQVGSVDDPLEQEADAVADQVMRMPKDHFIHRKCAECEKEEEKKLHRKPSDESSIPFIQTKSEGNPTVHGSIANAITSSKGNGSPLDGDTQSFMSSRFGSDFHHVRIHTDNEAIQLSKDLNAKAFTVGSDIYFNEGQYQPNTAEGNKLMAHELTHVVQQNTFSQAKQIQRELKDPLDIIQGYTEKTVSTIMLDRGSRRTRFFTKGGNYYNGTIVSLTHSFANGEYLAKKSDSKDPLRTWNIYYADNKPYLGGLQFEVNFKEVNFDELDYTSPVSLIVGEGLLPKLIDIEARVMAIAKIASQFRVGTEDEQKIIQLLSDIPAEQSKDFIDQLSSYKVGGENLIDVLDSAIDLEENMALHEALSKIRLRANAAQGAKNLSNAPVLVWHDVMGFFEQAATFSAEKMPNGKIRIRYLGGIAGGLYSKPEFKEIADINKRERLNWMTGGIELDPDQAVIVHDYDRDRYVVLTAIDLITYQHAGKRKFLEDVATIASLATPIGAETAVGRALAITFEKVLPALVLLVEENKLNIKKWFPNWGPAIIQATEMVKIGLAIYGAAQFIRGGWSVFQKLRQIRNARKLMDAAAIAEDASEIARAEKVATQLESQADQLLEPAEKMRQELIQADVAAGKVPALPGPAAESSAVKPAASGLAPTSEEILKAQQGALFKGISSDTEALFNTEKGKKLKQLLEANPDVALFVKFCKSPCWPDLNEAQIGKIREIMRKADIHGVSLNEAEFKAAMHGKSSKEVDDILEIISEGLQKKIEARAPTLPIGPSTMESAEKLRNMPGLASGGDRLPYVKGKWIEQGKIGRFPKQIADKMRGRTYRSFKEFREHFWQLVAADPNLSPIGKDGKSILWSESNLAKMKKGEAPVVSPLPGSGKQGKMTLELDHKLAIKNEGGVYDLDNLDIVHKEFHEMVGEK